MCIKVGWWNNSVVWNIFSMFKNTRQFVLHCALWHLYYFALLHQMCFEIMGRFLNCNTKCNFLQWLSPLLRRFLRPATAMARVRSRVGQCGIFSRKSDFRTCFSLCTLVLILSVSFHQSSMIISPVSFHQSSMIVSPVSFYQSSMIISPVTFHQSSMIISLSRTL